MREDSRLQVLSVLPQKLIEKTIIKGSSADAVEILESLSEKAASKIIKKLDLATQNLINTSLSYDDGQVGRHTNQEVFTIDENAKINEVIIEMRQGVSSVESNSFIVLGNDLQFVGEISFNELLNAPKTSMIKDSVNKAEITILDKQSLLDASNLVRSSHRNYLPVINKDGKFIGVFSIHDALHVFQDYYEAQVAHLGKVSDEDLFAPVFSSAKRRAIWLGINLLTAFLASFVISVFDKVLLEVVALAVLMPIVASMGGITGSQSLTLTVRGLATKQVTQGNLSVLSSKELRVAIINSTIWAVLVAVVCLVWFQNSTLSLIIAMSIIVNMSIAAFAGVYIPVLLEKLGVDPAIAGSVILTTVTDIVGFFVFLGSATQGGITLW